MFPKTHKTVELLLVWWWIILVRGQDHDKMDMFSEKREGEYSGHFSQCSGSQQIGIMKSDVKCRPHLTMVEIPKPDISQLMHIIPSHTTVNRCGGSCPVTGRYCTFNEVEMVPVDVIIISSASKSGGLSTLCSTVQVQQDIGCKCGCPVDPSYCSPSQRFDPTSCRCLCKNWKTRSQCNQDGRWWDQESCSCKCSPSLYRQCSTGYTYDFGNTCQCVPNYMKASLPLFTLIGVGVLAFIILGTSVAVYIDKKKIINARKKSKQRILDSQEDDCMEEQ